MDDLTLQDACETACENLPNGWLITISLEKDAGWVDLQREHVRRPLSDLCDTSEMSLAEQVREAQQQAWKLD